MGIINDMSGIPSTHRTLDFVLNIIRSGDKFNALSEAVTAIMELLRVDAGTMVHVSYLEFDKLSETPYQNFKLPARQDNGKLRINLFTGDDDLKHFETDRVPFFAPEELTKLINKPYVQLNSGQFYFFVWSHRELIAAVEIEKSNLKTLNKDLSALVDVMSQCLSFSLQNLSNDLQLLGLKKQLEKQKQQITQDKQIIERQNQIFRSLMESMSGVNKTDMEGIFNDCLSKLKDLFPKMGFGLVVDGEREGIVQWVCFLGLSKIDQELVLDNPADLTEISKVNSGSYDENWSVLPMTGQEGKQIGKLLIKGDQLQEENRNIIILFLEQLSAYTENKLLIRQLERIANLDGLTGAYNRYYFDKELERIIQNAKRFTKLNFSILLIDLNGLKMVNDNFGHRDGDQMIIATAELLMKVCRKSDIVCRYGGDEFIVLCPSTSHEQAMRLLDRLREEEKSCFIECHDNDSAVQKKPVRFSAVHKIPVRLSIGLSSSSEGIAPAKVLEIADQRMYVDKEEFYNTNTRYR